MTQYKYTGNDNYGIPKQKFIDEIHNMTDEQLRETCEKYIWLSAYANNNPRSDYHWQCDACYDECDSRGKVEVYVKAHKQVVKDVRG